MGEHRHEQAKTVAVTPLVLSFVIWALMVCWILQSFHGKIPAHVTVDFAKIRLGWLYYPMSILTGLIALYWPLFIGAMAASLRGPKSRPQLLLLITAFFLLPLFYWYDHAGPADTAGKVLIGVSPLLLGLLLYFFVRPPRWIRELLRLIGAVEKNDGLAWWKRSFALATSVAGKGTLYELLFLYSLAALATSGFNQWQRIVLFPIGLASAIEVAAVIALLTQAKEHEKVESKAT